MEVEIFVMEVGGRKWIFGILENRKSLACGGRKEIKEKKKRKRNYNEKIFSWKGI